MCEFCVTYLLFPLYVQFYIDCVLNTIVVSSHTSAILVLKIIIVLIFMPFLVFNFSFYSISILKIILVSIFILFTIFNFSFYSILILEIILVFILILFFKINFRFYLILVQF